MNTYDGARFNNISWPSLYSPAKEVGFLGPPIRPGGYYLSEPDDIFRFTLYWTLIFHLPFSFIAGIYTFFNFLFPPAKSAAAAIVLASPVLRPQGHSRNQSQSQSQPHSRAQSQSQSQSYTQAQSQLHGESPPEMDAWPPPQRANARRSRLTFALIVLLTFLGVSLLRAVLGAAVIACVLYGVYRAGGFYMSTWIPFIWAVIQSLIALLEIWPSIIDIV